MLRKLRHRRSSHSARSPRRRRCALGARRRRRSTQHAAHAGRLVPAPGRSSPRTAPSSSTSSRRRGPTARSTRSAPRSRTTRSSATEKLTDIEKEASGVAPSVGVNGDFFAANPGAPTGIVMRGGALDSAPAPRVEPRHRRRRHAHGLHASRFDGTWRGTDQRRQLDLNDGAGRRPHDAVHVCLGCRRLPPEDGVVEDVIGSLPPTAAERRRERRRHAGRRPGGIPIPPGGAVLVVARHPGAAPQRRGARRARPSRSGRR